MRIRRVGLELVEQGEWKSRIQGRPSAHLDVNALDVVPYTERIVEVKRPKKRTPDNERVLEFVISDGSVDRQNDVINPKGWDLKQYRKNPMVLFAHDSGMPPIALASDTKNEGEELVSAAEFHPPDLNPFADMIYRMYAGGWMRAVSVGFRPIVWTLAEDEERRQRYGFDFEKQELLEWSCVPIPANPAALMRAHEAGVNTRPLKTWAEQVLDLKTPLRGIGINDVENAWKAVRGPARSFAWIELADDDEPLPTPLPADIADADVVVHPAATEEEIERTITDEPSEIQALSVGIVAPITFARDADGTYLVLRNGTLVLARIENPDDIEWDDAGVISLRSHADDDELEIDDGDDDATKADDPDEIEIEDDAATDAA